MGIDYLPQSYRDLPPADSNYTGPRYAPGPASKRAATPEGRIDSMIAKKMRTSSDLVRLEEYFYATMDGDTAVISYCGLDEAVQLKVLLMCSYKLILLSSRYSNPSSKRTWLSSATCVRSST